MSMTDPIADMLSRIKNATMRGYSVVDIPASRLKREIGAILQKEGFIQTCTLVTEDAYPTLRLELKYVREGEPVIRGMKRISRPGHRVYVGHRKIPTVMGEIGMTILSTPKGVMTGQESRREKVGGEVLCSVW